MLNLRTNMRFYSKSADSLATKVSFVIFKANMKGCMDLG